MNGLLFSNIAAAAAIFAIILLRKFFKNRIFSKVFVLLWVLVIFRLLLPFEFSSGASIYAPIREQKTEILETEDFLWKYVSESEFFSQNQEPINPSESQLSKKAKISSYAILHFIWLSGAVFCGSSFAFRHRKNTNRIMSDCVPFDNVPPEFSGGRTRFYKSSSIASPLSFGIFRPVIIVPEDLSEEQVPFVLLHEHTHIKDHDAVLKAFALFALSLNWFNPAVWLMVKIFDRDLELYCDERVLSALGNEKAALYANTILDFAERESLSLSFFSAASLYERVTSIMNNKNKKSRFFTALAIFASVVFIMTACGTSPEVPKEEPLEAGNLSEGKNSAEEIDKLLQKYVEVQLGDNSVAIVDIESGETAALVQIDPNTGNVIAVNKNPENIVTEIPGLAEELMGYSGEVPPNNYVTDTYSIMQIEKIEKISVSGFSFAEGSSVNVLLIPSDETKISITYGDALRENGIFVHAGNDEIIVSVGTPCENIEEAFDLRIYGDFENAEIDIENFGYSVYSPYWENPPEIGYTETYLAVEDFEIQMASPVAEGWIASGFESYEGHTGIDIASESGTGTEILSVADGQVVKVKWDNTGYGYHVIINHGGGIQTLYAHMNDIYVKQGQHVKMGDTIGTMGSTGNSTGIHLHFELRIRGEYTDPSEFVLQS